MAAMVPAEDAEGDLEPEEEEDGCEGEGEEEPGDGAVCGPRGGGPQAGQGAGQVGQPDRRAGEVSFDNKRSSKKYACKSDEKPI